MGRMARIEFSKHLQHHISEEFLKECDYIELINLNFIFRFPLPQILRNLVKNPVASNISSC